MIDARAEIENTLARVLQQAHASESAPRLAAAIQHAVFPGGARLHPQLCLAVAGACEADNPRLALAAATAIELLHCASLVCDDLDWLNNAPLRRGKPSVPTVYGESVAEQASNELIAVAFQSLADIVAESSSRTARLFKIIGLGVGAPAGLAAAQAWKCEPGVELRDCHNDRTGGSFVAATMAGAAAAGSEPEPWREMGLRLDEAAEAAGALLRDSSVTIKTFKYLVGKAVDAIPTCPKAAELRLLIVLEAREYMPEMQPRRVA
jgi:geranylgeranyl diphosphate synthase, type II